MRSAQQAVTRARFPHLPTPAAHYESFFLTACHPAGGLAVWIRFTVHKRPNAPLKGFVWFTLFDRVTGVAASKVTHPAPAAPPDAYIRLGDCTFAPGTARGSAPSAQLDASWDLRFEGSDPPLWHLPSWAYRSPLPRTKVLSPYPQVVFNGTVRAGDRTIAVRQWPGTVGHNWGSEHARRAIWIHGSNFHGHPDAWLDLVLARVSLGPFTAPWIGNGALFLEGRRHRLGGIQRMRTTSVDESVEHCRFALEGDDLRLAGEIGAVSQSFVGWIYSQPKGGERQTIHCSIADLRLDIARPQTGDLALTLAGGAAYELQMDGPYEPIPVQPFPDG